MLKIRRSHRLIFDMGIPIPWKDGLYIETGPWWHTSSICTIAWMHYYALHGCIMMPAFGTGMRQGNTEWSNYIPRSINLHLFDMNYSYLYFCSSIHSHRLSIIQPCYLSCHGNSFCIIGPLWWESTHIFTNCNGSLIKLLLKTWHIWVILSKYFTSI